MNKDKVLDWVCDRFTTPMRTGEEDAIRSAAERILRLRHRELIAPKERRGIVAITATFTFFWSAVINLGSEGEIGFLEGALIGLGANGLCIGMALLMNLAARRIARRPEYDWAEKYQENQE